MADRQRTVFIGHTPQFIGYQFMAWHRRHGFKHPRVQRLLVERLAGQPDIRRDFLQHGLTRRAVRILTRSGCAERRARGVEHDSQRSVPDVHGVQ